MDRPTIRVADKQRGRYVDIRKTGKQFDTHTQYDIQAHAYAYRHAYRLRDRLTRMQAYKERQHACMLMLPAYMHAATTARLET